MSIIKNLIQIILFVASLTVSSFLFANEVSEKENNPDKSTEETVKKIPPLDISRIAHETNGKLTFASLGPIKTVYFDSLKGYEDNLFLVDLVRPYFEARGVQVVNNKDEADVSLYFFANLFIGKPGGKENMAGIGTLIKGVDKEKLTTFSTSLGHQFNAGLAASYINNKMSTSSYLALSFLDDFLRSIGVAGAFNKALAGDERGFCLFKCDGWNDYTQRVVVMIRPTKGGKKLSVSSAVTDVNIYPIELFQSSFENSMKTFFEIKENEEGSQGSDNDKN